MEKQVLDKLKYMINKKRSVEDILETFEIEDYELYGLVYLLNKQGFPCKIVGNAVIKTYKPDLSFNRNQVIHAENNTSFCFISDLHYASVFDRPDIIKKIYEMCHEREISTIFCAGDITDGFYPYHKKHFDYLKAFDAKGQIEYVVNTHPYDPNIKMYMITGNHDYTHFQNEGVMIGEKIQDLRSDIIYLGHEEADVMVDKLKIKLCHGKVNNPEDITRTAQSILDRVSTENRPDILQTGHIHRSVFYKDGRTNVFQTGALIDQTPYLSSLKTKSERCCWFADIDYDNDGEVISITPELYNFGPSLSRKRVK